MFYELYFSYRQEERICDQRKVCKYMKTMLQLPFTQTFIFTFSL